MSDKIERYLCEAILSGRYQSGERLSPTALAKQFDVSAMPVREALVALHKVGLVEMVARRGFRVAQLSWRDIEDAFAVQAFISGRLAASAAAVIAPDDVAGLRRLQEEIEGTADEGGASAAARIETLNYSFHRTINMLSDANQLRRFLRVTTWAIPRQLHAVIPGWIESTVGEHRRIIDALEAHDGATARNLTEEHVRRAGALVLEQLVGGGSWDREGPTLAPVPRAAGIEAAKG
ncbi:MAG TPA: GntR family transcriptional regulator [Solirubrobacterales bacterium]